MATEQILEAVLNDIQNNGLITNHPLPDYAQQVLSSDFTFNFYCMTILLVIASATLVKAIFLWKEYSKDNWDSDLAKAIIYSIVFLMSFGFFTNTFLNVMQIRTSPKVYIVDELSRQLRIIQFNQSVFIAKIYYIFI